MPLLTIFTAPKPFSDPHIDTIQRNAILSWINLGSEVEVLLVGEETGLKEAAAQYNIRHLPKVRRSSAGTPLVSSIFELAQKAAKSPFISYVNADILLTPETIKGTKQVSSQIKGHFLMIGQRWDLDVNQLMDFSNGWERRLRHEARNNGNLHKPAGSDYFIYPRSAAIEMPDFSIGRAGWDNWLIYYAHSSGWDVIDATPTIDVIHQNHDYSHLPDGKPHYDHDESMENMAIAGGAYHMYMILDAEKQLINGQVVPAQISLSRVIRALERRVMPANGVLSGRRGSLTRRLRRLRRKIT